MNAEYIYKLYDVSPKLRNTNKERHEPKKIRSGVRLEKEKIIATLREHRDLCKSHLSKLSGVTSHTTDKTVEALKLDGVIVVSEHNSKGRKTFSINLKSSFR